MKEDSTQLLYESIICNMQEGIFTLDMMGHITSMNSAAEKILCLDRKVIGEPFALTFMEEEENDDFCQAVLEAVYDQQSSHSTVTGYRKGDQLRQLHISTTYLKEDNEVIGVTAVINDVTELEELRDAVKAMEKIRTLNAELERRNLFIRKTFGRYLSDDIVREILGSEKGLEIGGKKQNVTMMFTDLRGFTALSERMDPKALIDMLNAYLERMINILMAHKGNILEFIGDAIVTVFGAPLETETHPMDAVACAIEMQCAMLEVNAFNREHGYPELEMGIGIHSGEVILGNIGSEKKTKYDIIGRNVNLASRVESYTVGGQILVSAVVREACGPALETGTELQVSPKGVKNPIMIYEVLALNGNRAPKAEQCFAPLQPARLVMFRLLDGKHMEVEGNPGRVIEISEKELLMETETEIPLYASVLLKVAGEELYAKMLEETPRGNRLHLTSGSMDVFIK